MAFDPERDISLVWEELVADTALLVLLNISTLTTTQIREHILRKNDYHGLASSARRLNIYYRPSRTLPDNIHVMETIQVDCHVPNVLEYIAYDVLKQVKETLCDPTFLVANKRLYFGGQLGQLQTDADYFCAGERFYYYRVI